MQHVIRGPFQATSCKTSSSIEEGSSPFYRDFKFHEEHVDQPSLNASSVFSFQSSRAVTLVLPVSDVCILLDYTETLLELQ